MTITHIDSLNAPIKTDGTKYRVIVEGNLFEISDSGSTELSEVTGQMPSVRFVSIKK